MLKAIKSLLKANSLLIAILITGLIAYLSLIKTPQLSYNISNLDKLQHGFAYFVLTLSWFVVLKKSFLKYRYLVVFSCISYGVFLEILQKALTSFRTGDVLDALANSLGVCIALLIFNTIYRKNKGI